MGSAWALEPWLFLAETWQGPRGALCSGSWFGLFFGSPIFPGAFGGVGWVPGSWDLEECLASDISFLQLQLYVLRPAFDSWSSVECPLVWLLTHFEPDCFQCIWCQASAFWKEQSGAEIGLQYSTTRHHHQSHCKLFLQATLQSQWSSLVWMLLNCLYSN